MVENGQTVSNSKNLKTLDSQKHSPSQKEGRKINETPENENLPPGRSRYLARLAKLVQITELQAGIEKEKEIDEEEKEYAVKYDSRDFIKSIGGHLNHIKRIRQIRQRIVDDGLPSPTNKEAPAIKSPGKITGLDD